MIIKQFKLQFGFLCDPLNNQIESQGFRINKAVAKNFEKDRESINRLIDRGLLSGSQSKICFQKLIKKIEKQIE